MVLVRVIPIDQLSSAQILNLEQFGFTLVHKTREIQVWVERAAHRD